MPISRGMDKEDVVYITMKWNCAIWGDTDGPRDCQTEWSKSVREKQISYINAYMWKLDSSSPFLLTLLPSGRFYPCPWIQISSTGRQLPNLCLVTDAALVPSTQFHPHLSSVSPVSTLIVLMWTTRQLWEATLPQPMSSAVSHKVIIYKCKSNSVIAHEILLSDSSLFLEYSNILFNFLKIWPDCMTYRIVQDPNQKSNLHPWQWKHGGLTTRPSGNSQIFQ